MIENILIQVLLLSIFLIISLITFTLPSYVILRLINYKSRGFLEDFTIASIFGIAFFTISTYILSFLHLRFFIWIIPILGILILVKTISRINFAFIKEKINSNKFLLLILFLGIIFQVAVNAPSGMEYKDGIYFYSSHGHDGIWHLSLMERLKKDEFPFKNPEFLSKPLQNYHFFSDLLMSEVSRLYKFSNLDIYFRFMPVVFSLLLGLSSFLLVRKWIGSKVAGFWSIFFVYFAGSFGYFLTIPQNHNLSGETIFWVSQTHSVLGNPPHASAFIIFIAFLISFFNYSKERNKTYFWLSIFFGAVIIEFKVYAGLLILGGLLLTGIFELIIKRKFEILGLFIYTLIFSLIIYLPNSKNSQEFLVFEPWWFIRTMVVAPDRLNWLDLELRRQTYIYEGNWKRVIQVEATAFLIFLFGNLGMRFIGFFTYFKLLLKGIYKEYFNLFFISVTTASFLIPVLFLQKGVVWNTIQFNQYFLLFFGFLAAITTAELIKFLKFNFLKIIVSAVIIILSVPTQVGLLLQFYTNQPLSKLTFESLDSLSYLRSISLPSDIILTAPFDKFSGSEIYPPKPIHNWYDTGYVSAFSGRTTLLSDEEQIKIMGYKIDELLKEREEAFSNESGEKLEDFAKKYSARYLYLESDQGLLNVPKSFELIYDKGGIKIYKI